jgi:DNA (cytosine-5)-methyltransferase 1
MRRPDQPSYTVASLFSGVGGICLGFIQAGGKVLWANDFDEKACITYRANFPHTLYQGDIHSINEKDVAPVDIVASGFPCQAFSIAGYQKGFQDKRGDLFFETLRFIKSLKPKAYLLENVKNLAAHDSGRTMKVIKDHLIRAGYSFISKVMNTMEFGNIPQNRERIYVVGFRGESSYNGREMDTRAVCSRAFVFPEKVNLNIKLEAMLDRGRADAYFYYNRYPNYTELKKRIRRRDTAYQWRRAYVRENKSNVCPTLTANMGTGGHNVPLIRDRWGIRKLTPRECFRLQGFPESYVLPALARSYLYKQAGNSVSVPVIRRIATAVFHALDVKYC